MPIPAIVAALLPVFADKVPELVKMVGATKEERKEQATAVAVDAITKALNAANAQQAAELVQSDPAAAATARKAVQEAWFEIQEAGGGGIDGARAADVAFASSHEPVWRSPSFLALVLLTPLVYLIVLSLIGMVGTAVWSDDVRAALAGERVLAVSTDQAHSLGDVLGVAVPPTGGRS